MKFLVTFLFLSCTPLIAQTQTIDTLIASVKEMAGNLTNEASEYMLLAEISNLKAEMAKLPDGDKKNEAEAVIKTALEVLNVQSIGKIAEIIKGTRPLTAVLFSSQDRNSYEVVKDPADETRGIISQNQTGDTGGILIAAEAPFYFPDYPNRSVTPVGAWFGVRMQTGSGSDVSGVDLASGLSISYISARARGNLQNESDLSTIESARLLLGVIYGDVATLGAGLVEGSAFGLGEKIPLKRQKEISFAIGLGFRF